MSYFENNIINNDNSGKGITNWSTQRNSGERLRHRPHIVNTSNSRGEDYVRYYSSLDADIVFGDVFIDEVVSIVWQVQQQAMPIFGYNSYTFDDIAVGSRLISGQFTVNFIEANYLSRVQSVMTAISRKTYGQDIPATSSFTSLERQIRNTPKWDKGFDIVVGYGERKTNASEYDQVIILDCCQLTGCQQQLDYNGEPITETYSFIARDMKYVSSQQYNAVSGTSSENPYIESSIDAVSAAINIAANDSTIDVNISSTGVVIGGYLLLSEINSTVFNTKTELKPSSNGLQAEFTSEQKSAIADFVSKTALSKISTTLYYTIQKDGQLIPREIGLVIQINY